MNRNLFNPDSQNNSTTQKVVAGLARISEAFKSLLWEKAKQLGLSPIQIQILIFVAYHKSEFCTTTYLAKEFNVTKPTISDAVKVLHHKKLVLKDYSGVDSRSFFVTLTHKGKEVVSQTEDFANGIEQQLEGMDPQLTESLFKQLSALIFSLHRGGILEVQRTCYGCRFYDRNQTGHFCNLLEKPLNDADIRLDCPEFKQAG